MQNTTIKFFDSHIHLNDPRLFHDLDQHLLNAQHNNIVGWIIPATISEEFGAIHQITQNYPQTYAAYGLHPYFIQNHTEHDLAMLKHTLQTLPSVAIGECGLDAMIPEPNMDRQLYFFKAQIKLALELDLPLIVHTRKTVDLVLKEIRKHPNLKGVLHSFSGSIQQAEVAIKHNFFLGFGGNCTFPRANKLHSLIRYLSLDNILLETDAPFQRGAYSNAATHYPRDLLEIAKAIATLKEDSLQSIAQATTANVQKLFKLKEH